LVVDDEDEDVAVEEVATDVGVEVEDGDGGVVELDVPM
jgi:hypothetical protein